MYHKKKIWGDRCVYDHLASFQVVTFWLLAMARVEEGCGGKCARARARARVCVCVCVCVCVRASKRVYARTFGCECVFMCAPVSAEEIIDEEQAGCRSGRSTTEQIFNIRVLC